ncbi:hypothetical protein BDN70DRAFT_937619 [Pholiota conissans]|uniref:Uncharacterized protein n=1 Tax=Pholiota conissans TaxID=109636 RepID=A0A9P5YR42_9AGAR|nr:hypothetical protein BDN70DRAFT_937619 [Pholiota conissans]
MEPHGDDDLPSSPGFLPWGTPGRRKKIPAPKLPRKLAAQSTPTPMIDTENAAANTIAPAHVSDSTTAAIPIASAAAPVASTSTEAPWPPACIRANHARLSEEDCIKKVKAASESFRKGKILGKQRAVSPTISHDDVEIGSDVSDEPNDPDCDVTQEYPSPNHRCVRSIISPGLKPVTVPDSLSGATMPPTAAAALASASIANSTSSSATAGTTVPGPSTSKLLVFSNIEQYDSTATKTGAGWFDLLVAEGQALFKRLLKDILAHQQRALEKVRVTEERESREALDQALDALDAT